MNLFLALTLNEHHEACNSMIDLEKRSILLTLIYAQRQDIFFDCKLLVNNWASNYYQTVLGGLQHFRNTNFALGTNYQIKR